VGCGGCGLSIDCYCCGFWIVIGICIKGVFFGFYFIFRKLFFEWKTISVTKFFLKYLFVLEIFFRNVYIFLKILVISEISFIENIFQNVNLTSGMKLWLLENIFRKKHVFEKGFPEVNLYLEKKFSESHFWILENIFQNCFLNPQDLFRKTKFRNHFYTLNIHSGISISEAFYTFSMNSFGSLKVWWVVASKWGGAGRNCLKGQKIINGYPIIIGVVEWWEGIKQKKRLKSSLNEP